MSISYCYETSSSGLLKKGVSRVIDCPVEGLDVNSISEIRNFTHRSLKHVLYPLDAEYSVIFESSELIGYTHSLHKFRVPISSEQYISVRAILRGRKLIRVLFTIPIEVAVEVKYPVEKYTPVLEERGLEVQSPDKGSLNPPGQVYVDVPIVYAILGTPQIDISKWTLKVEGEVCNPVALSLPELYELGIESVKTKFHCVTGWSLKSVEFSGVPLVKIMDLAKPKSGVEWIYIECADDYSTIFPLSEAYDSKALIALEMGGKVLDVLHGYPARLVIPQLYGWKSAKWITKIVFTRNYRDGYWEALGYHPRGRVWLEERFKTK